MKRGLINILNSVQECGLDPTYKEYSGMAWRMGRGEIDR